MIIDFHTHTFPDLIAQKTVDFLKSKSKTVPFSDGTVKKLSNIARASGVDLSVVLPVVTNPVSASKINNYAATVNQSVSKTAVFSFGGIHPDTPDYKSVINEACRLNLKGIKIHPAYQQVALNDIRYKRIIGYASEKGLIVVSHGGKDIGIPGEWSTPQMASEILSDVKPEKFVMAHMGGWEMWNDVKTYLCGKKIYFDTAFCCVDFAYGKDIDDVDKQPVLAEEEFVSIIKKHGTDKILFGTDSPWGEQRMQIEFIKGLPVSEEDKGAILGKNAAKLLGL